MTNSRKFYYFILILFLFVFRLLFGICSEFWFEDELQIYLIGLKFFTTGNYPWFGPDVVYTSSQIPGSLQGLLVGLPFYLWHAPEAPYILLNLLSTTSICLFAFYIYKRLPLIPLWFTLTWLLTCPWTMHFSTHIVNPSYVLPASIVFFIAFFESLNSLSIKFISKSFSFFLMGVCLLWIVQLHMSWILLLPFLAFSFFTLFKDGLKSVALKSLCFITGSVVTGIFLFLTLLMYGFDTGSGGTSENIVFNIANFQNIVTVFTRFLSFAAYELPRFLGSNTNDRIDFIMNYKWAIIFILFAGLAGYIQPAWFVISSFLKNHSGDFKKFRLIAAVSFILIWISFFFSVKGPASHTFYCMFPVMMIFSFYTYEKIFTKKYIRILAIAFLFSGFIANVVIMHRNYFEKSLYKNRSVVQKAITEKNYHLLGERRYYDRNPE